MAVMDKKKVLVGLSSGVDSTVAALLLKNKGFEPLGVTFHFSDQDLLRRDELEFVRKFSAKIGIKHVTVDVRNEFKSEVMGYFIREYKAGRTPFPCALCNPQIKFKFLINYANELDCRWIATGHYARIKSDDGMFSVYKGVDKAKDQSFFLWGLPTGILHRIQFPLGNMQKSHVLDYSKKAGFASLASKEESRGICFIEGNDYRKFLKNNGLDQKTGHFINDAGTVIGKHPGYFNFTIGQRRGLGVQFNEALFVSEIQPKKNIVVLSPFNKLYKEKIFLSRSHFFHPERVLRNEGLTAKVHYRRPETPCQVQFQDMGRALVEFSSPVAMIAPGQTAVIYAGDRLIGGGFIEHAK